MATRYIVHATHEESSFTFEHNKYRRQNKRLNITTLVSPKCS